MGRIVPVILITAYVLIVGEWAARRFHRVWRRRGRRKPRGFEVLPPKDGGGA